jgi:hypothetical protein
MLASNKRLDRTPGPSGRGSGQPWRYVPSRFGRLVPLLALFLSTMSFSAVSTNVCSDSQSLREFAAAQTVSVDEGEASTEWSIRVPSTFRGEFSLAVLYVVLERSGREVMRAPLATISEDDSATSFFWIDTLERRRGLVATVFANYTDHPGETRFDGPYCEFEIGT